LLADNCFEITDWMANDVQALFRRHYDFIGLNAVRQVFKQQKLTEGRINPTISIALH